MSREAARTAVTTKAEALKASWSDYALKMEYENTLLDMSKQSKPFVRITLHYTDGYQANLGTSPTHRAVGGILIEALAKESTGSKVPNQLLDHFYKGMHMSDAMLPVRTYAAKFLPHQQAVNGWQSFAVVVPFWFDDIS